MVLKRSVCGLNTGERVSRRCVDLISRRPKERGFVTGFVRKSIEPPTATEETNWNEKAILQSDRLRILADATGTDLRTCRKHCVSDISISENRSHDALDFSDGRLEVRGDLLWNSRKKRQADRWVASRDMKEGSSQLYSLNRKRRWELFDRLYDAIEKQKQKVRTAKNSKIFGLEEKARNRHQSGNENTNCPAAPTSYLPFRVRALVLRPRAKDLYFMHTSHPFIQQNTHNLKGAPTVVACLDSHAPHCTAVRVARERSSAEYTHLEKCALKHSDRHRAHVDAEMDGLVALPEDSEAQVSGGKVDVMGTERPDLSDDQQNEQVEVSLNKRRKQARAAHHNQHFRGVQRPERWKAETRRALKGYILSSDHF